MFSKTKPAYSAGVMLAVVAMLACMGPWQTASAHGAVEDKWKSCGIMFVGQKCTLRFTVSRGYYAYNFYYADTNGVMRKLVPTVDNCPQSSCTIFVAGRGDGALPIGWAIAGFHIRNVTAF